jgi:phosphate-selective porin
VIRTCIVALIGLVAQGQLVWADSTDTQETDSNVGLFRLPAHHGEADAMAGREGFGVLSKDNAYGLMLHWVLQADGRADIAGDPDPSTFLVRFAGLALAVRLNRSIRSELLVSLSESKLVLSEAWLDGAIADWLDVKVGKFHEPISLERATTSIFFPLVDADLVSALLPSVDTGVQAWGHIGANVEYNAALLNGAVAGSVGDRDGDASKDVVGRVLAKPILGLTIGVGASAGRHLGTLANPELPRLTTWGGRTYFAYRVGTTVDTTVVATGPTYRVVPQASWHSGPVSVYAEAARTVDHVGGARVVSTAWSAVATAVLTGEPAIPLHYVVPSHDLDFEGGSPGAFELVVGAGAIDIDDEGQLGMLVDPNSAMRAARTISGGINWYPSINVRAMLDLEHTTFTAISSVPTAPAETLLVGRFQLVL